MSKWEVTPQHVTIYYVAYDTRKSRGESPTRCVIEGLSAVIAADPLLSAAKDMQDALAALTDAVRSLGSYKRGEAYFDDVLQLADAALSKSRGEV